MGKRGWLIFAEVQFVGVWVPVTFTNVHSNMAPLFVGLLLLPGIVVWFLFPHSDVWPAVIAIPVNALFWHFIVKAFKSGTALD